MDELYFKGKAERYIFMLVETDGRVMMSNLGASKHYYFNKNLATRWMNAIESVIHPDVCSHPKAPEAMEKLKIVYNRMIGWKKEKANGNSKE